LVLPTAGTLNGALDGRVFTFEAAIDNSSTQGVAGGIVAANAANARATTTGLELCIPKDLLDFANGDEIADGDAIGVFVTLSGVSPNNFFSNQFLPGLDTPANNLGDSGPDLSAVVSSGVTHQINTDLFLEDHFDYTTGQDVSAQAAWSAHSGAGNSPPQVIAGNLQYPGLEPSVGASMEYADVGGSIEDVNTPIGRVMASGEVWYASFIVNPVNQPGNEDYFAHFKDSGNDFAARVYTRVNGAGVDFGISPDFDAGNRAFVTGPFAVNTPHLIVIRYDYDADEASLWVNPALVELGGTAPAPDVTAPAGSSSADVEQFAFRGDSDNGNLIFDSLRVGNSWKAVTPRVIFVDVNVAGGTGDGSSWANAYTDFSDAVTTATAGSQLWVAEGTYSESLGVIGLVSDVGIYGGFEGSGGAEETLLSERDAGMNITTIDFNNFARISGSGVNTITLDGLALDFEDFNGPFLPINIFSNSSNVNFSQIISRVPTSPMSSTMDIDNSAINIDSFIFEGDASFGAVEIFNGNSQTVNLINSVIPDALGVIGVFMNGGSGGYVNLVNSTINGAGTGLLSENGSTITLTNTIISNCSNRGIVQQTAADTFVINHCLFNGNTVDYRDVSTTTNYNGAAAINGLAGNANNVDGDPMFTDEPNGDLTLDDFSAAIDQGDDSAAPSVDALGNPRDDNSSFVNGPGGFSDIGAYEADPSVVPVELSSFQTE
jgi:hypothetical protein